MQKPLTCGLNNNFICPCHEEIANIKGMNSIWVFIVLWLSFWKLNTFVKQVTLIRYRFNIDICFQIFISKCGWAFHNFLYGLIFLITFYLCSQKFARSKREEETWKKNKRSLRNHISFAFCAKVPFIAHIFRDKVSCKRQ